MVLAQRLNSDPYYLTGETDENNGYSAEVVQRFLLDKGYEKLLGEYEKTKPLKKEIQEKKHFRRQIKEIFKATLPVQKMIL